MKILFPFIGDNVGGSHISSLFLIKHLDEKKFNPQIVIHEKGKLYNFLKKKNIKFYFLSLHLEKNLKNIFLNPLLFLRNILRIREFVKKNNFKIIHGNDLRINFFWSIGSFMNSIFIWHQRTLIKRKSIINLFALIFSRYIICISNSTVKSFGYENIDKIKKIYNSFNKTKKIKINKNKNKITFLLCSKLIEDKNVDLFFQIINHLNSFKKNYLFWILGDGPLKKNYQIKFKSKKNVKFFGFKENTEKYFRKADLLIAPSINEAFGRTLVESLNNGTYVIASKNKSFREISNDDSLITFTNNNYKSFVKKINYVIKKKLYLKKKNIQKKFQKSLDLNFSIKNIKKIEKIYEQSKNY